MPIYSRQGDDGSTHVIGGIKLSKSHPLLEAIGSIDELNVYIGYARLLSSDEGVANLLKEIQSDLMRLSAELASVYSPTIGRKSRNISSDDVQRLELYIDEYEAKLPSISKLLIPYGSEDSMQLQLARVVCRRAERAVVRLFKECPIGDHKYVIPYLNRLSDLLFILARYLNLKSGFKEEYWEI